MNKLPSFQFYPGDWLDFRVMRMSYAAQGVYVRILCHMWRDSKDQCSITTDLKQLSQVLGLSHDETAKYMMEIQFEDDKILDMKDDRFISRRLQRARKEYIAYKRTRSDAGAKGAAARWHKGSDRIATEVAKPCPSPSPSPSLSPSEEEERLPPTEASGPAVVLWGHWKAQREAAPIGRDKGVRMILFALKRGAKYPALEQAFLSSKHCAGKFIWEILDELTPKGQPGQKSMMEILQKFGGGK